jgi:hypothetical protein
MILTNTMSEIWIYPVLKAAVEQAKDQHKRLAHLTKSFKTVTKALAHIR